MKFPQTPGIEDQPTQRIPLQRPASLADQPIRRAPHQRSVSLADQPTQRIPLRPADVLAEQPTEILHLPAARENAAPETVAPTRARPDSLVGKVTQRLLRRRALLLLTLLAVVVECVPGVPGLALAPAGLWLLFGAPIMLWYAAADAFVSTRDGRTILAVGCTVLSDIVIALGVNTILPVAGFDKPLQTIPLTVGALLFIVGLAAIAPVSEPSANSVPWWRAQPAPDLIPIVALGSVAVLLAVAGAIRLNNGLGGTVSMAALIVVAALMTFLLVRRRRHLPIVTGVGIFFIALALLLLTSLRGWNITGHDIQREFKVFEITYQASRWNIADFRNAYNACLSLNLLPTSIVRLTGIPSVYVFKAVFPVIFAVAPVALYRSVRHGGSQIVALLSAVYFVAFPTFFTDMAFLVRQEVAFVMLGCIMVLFADAARPRAVRQNVATIMLIGIVLTHYSTTYVVLAALGLAYVLGFFWGLAVRKRAIAATRRRLFVTWWMIGIAGIAAVVWTGPLTHTGDQARLTAKNTVLQLLSGKFASASSDTAYSIFGGAKVSTAERLADYAEDTLSQTSEDRADGEYLPLDVINRHPAEAVEQAKMPLTGLGTVLEKVGVNVATVNTVVRQSVAKLLQVLLLVGLILAVFVPRRRIYRPAPEHVALGAGGLGVLALLTVLPELSVDYGVLRAFQQGLFFFAPFIAGASIWIFRWAGKRATAMACVMAMFLFVDLVGIVPKLTGGYPPQLHLANAGQYYDIYYLHPEERASIDWLQTHVSEAERDDVQSEIQTDRYTFGRMQSVLDRPATNDIFPTLVGPNTYVFLGFTTVQKGEATIFYRGDLVTYRYPVDLLDETKNKIYSSEGAEIYR
ncbi:DUF2206 domain-containing protein [Actinoplanes regularis]|uniref:DUF2206 domain-containing protein n=1 Tax=Actinoplanes regularis TaxID=52697 RepID=UPI0024A043D0|nr:DUF2206 domain-containing protein [Actinoplanes regularis]GLW33449.1 hypothetical protein Areg01_63870 [Actinoplanes regularis]